SIPGRKRGRSSRCRSWSRTREGLISIHPTRIASGGRGTPRATWVTSRCSTNRKSSAVSISRESLRRHGRACHRKSGLPDLRHFILAELRQARGPIPSTSFVTQGRRGCPAPQTSLRSLRKLDCAAGHDGGEIESHQLEPALRDEAAAEVILDVDADDFVEAVLGAKAESAGAAGVRPLGPAGHDPLDE